MSKMTKVLVTILIILILLLAGLAAFWFFTNNVIVDGTFYPKSAEFLNLSKKEITAEDYEKIQQALPGTQISWNVPVDGRSSPVDEKEVTVKHLTDADMKGLSHMKNLKKLHAVGCTDYERLMQVAESLPGCLVEYVVSLDGTDYPQDVTELQLKNLTEEDVAKVAYLPGLTQIHAEDCKDYAQLAQLQQAHPDIAVNYYVEIGDMKVAVDVRDLTAENADLTKIGENLVYLTGLKKLMLVNPKGNMEDLKSLQAAFPQVTFDWKLERDGVVLSKEAEDLDLSGVTLNSIEEVEQILAFCPNVKQVYLGLPNIDNEAIAQFREKKRSEYKVVWTVMCGSLDVRTDATYFHPTGRGVFYFYDKDCVNLKYCEDMICLDLGHMSITSCEFVRNMPNLKYLILGCCGQLKDITPLETCKNVVWLELYLTSVLNLEPLLGMTALEDLNMGYNLGDPAIVAQMTWLKNLWWSGCSAKGKGLLYNGLPDTYINFAATNSTSGGWRKLDNYYNMRDALNAHYMD